MRITDWPCAERPREKLLSCGAAILSDAELLAIFFRNGVVGMNAVDLARALLEKYGGLYALLQLEMGDFCSNKGVGVAKYTQLQAGLTIGRRYLHASLMQKNVLTHTGMLKDYLRHRLDSVTREVFAVLLLDTQNQIIRFDILFVGSLNHAAVYPREIVHHVLKHGGASVILVHNHPSGCVEPSSADRELTTLLEKVLRMVEVRTLDHIIVGSQDQWWSFAEQGLL